MCTYSEQLFRYCWYTEMILIFGITLTIYIDTTVLTALLCIYFLTFWEAEEKVLLLKRTRIWHLCPILPVSGRWWVRGEGQPSQALVKHPQCESDTGRDFLLWAQVPGQVFTHQLWVPPSKSGSPSFPNCYSSTLPFTLVCLEIHYSRLIIVVWNIETYIFISLVAAFNVLRSELNPAFSFHVENCHLHKTGKWLSRLPEMLPKIAVTTLGF
jgi:hypothetical protein